MSYVGNQAAGDQSKKYFCDRHIVCEVPREFFERPTLEVTGLSEAGPVDRTGRQKAVKHRTIFDWESGWQILHKKWVNP